MKALAFYGKDGTMICRGDGVDLAVALNKGKPAHVVVKNDHGAIVVTGRLDDGPGVGMSLGVSACDWKGDTGADQFPNWPISVSRSSPANDVILSALVPDDAQAEIFEKGQPSDE